MQLQNQLNAAADPVTVNVVRNLPEIGKQQLPSASLMGGGQHLCLKKVRTLISDKGVVSNIPRNDGVLRSLGSSDRARSTWSGRKSIEAFLFNLLDSFSSRAGVVSVCGGESVCVSVCVCVGFRMNSIADLAF